MALKSQAIQKNIIYVKEASILLPQKPNSRKTNEQITKMENEIFSIQNLKIMRNSNNFEIKQIVNSIYQYTDTKFKGQRQNLINQHTQKLKYDPNHIIQCINAFFLNPNVAIISSQTKIQHNFQETNQSLNQCFNLTQIKKENSRTQIKDKLKETSNHIHIKADIKKKQIRSQKVKNINILKKNEQDQKKELDNDLLFQKDSVFDLDELRSKRSQSIQQNSKTNQILLKRSQFDSKQDYHILDQRLLALRENIRKKNKSIVKTTNNFTSDDMRSSPSYITLLDKFNGLQEVKVPKQKEMFLRRKMSVYS